MISFENDETWRITKASLMLKGVSLDDLERMPEDELYDLAAIKSAEETLQLMRLAELLGKMFGRRG